MVKFLLLASIYVKSYNSLITELDSLSAQRLLENGKEKT
jgi:hypothetical protein